MFPKRGAFAAFITTVLLVLVLTVKTPDQLPQDDSGAFAPQSETPSLVAYVESQTSNAGAPASGGQSDQPSPAASSGQPGGPNQTQTGGTNAQATPPPAGVPNATNPPTGSASAPPNPASNAGACRHSATDGRPDEKLDGRVRRHDGADEVGPGPGSRRLLGRQDHRRHRVADAHRRFALPADRPESRPNPPLRGAVGSVRDDQHGLRRHVHEHRLQDLAPVCDRQGQGVTRARTV